MKFTDITTGKYIVAVSGGVDSVVLLHLLVQQKNVRLVVAHFDHGIREDSAKDAQFVKNLAGAYNLPFVHKRVELGEAASEEAAREARYAFLNEVKEDYGAIAIITAHHADDVLETIIINIIRGTGWRGISALRSEGSVIRPLLHLKKDAVYTYAKQHNLSWREDETNEDGRYLRNYVRLNIVPKLSLDEKQQFLALHSSQVELKKQIDKEAQKLLDVAKIKQNKYSRYFFTNANEAVAIELLKFLTHVTYPQLKTGLLAIKVAHANTVHQMGGGVELTFTKTSFIVVHPSFVIS
ncbi:tRNA lysidine(34) synthetase TilS [Candidatus Saccharibacteria bacterium]|nr:tRNA lysidine(34) synthetase TilS [Candidatus Saccharibacteria bacterium]